jgi:hypothetical protein
MAAIDPLGSAKTATICDFTLCAAAEVRWRRFVERKVLRTMNRTGARKIPVAAALVA